MNNRKHVYDHIDICVKCDRCRDEECCPGASADCDGTNWDFLDRYRENPKQFLTRFVCGCPESCAVAGPHCITPRKGDQ